MHFYDSRKELSTIRCFFFSSLAMPLRNWSEHTCSVLFGTQPSIPTVLFYTIQKRSITNRKLHHVGIIWNQTLLATWLSKLGMGNRLPVGCHPCVDQFPQNIFFKYWNNETKLGSQPSVESWKSRLKRNVVVHQIVTQLAHVSKKLLDC
jgi:hypothetical protein